MTARFDYIVVGAGLFGAVFAQQARRAGRTVLVIEERGHVAGNCHTQEMYGIHVHSYGPHIFHTNSREVWNYVNHFAQFNRFVNRVKSIYEGTAYSMPINLMTFNQVAGCLTPADAQAYLAEHRVPCENPRNLEDWALSQVGRELYEKLIRGYTKKQWMRDPKDLPASIIRRLPIRLTYDDNYYNDTYQGIPVGGYTRMVERMLEGVQVELGTSLSSLGDWRRFAAKLVYTGPIDAFFGYSLGELEYRTLRFDNEVHAGDYQGNAQVNYAEESVPYTRVVEHKHFEFGAQEKTVITKEYPVAWSKGRTPYYSINDELNNDLHDRYLKLAKGVQGLIGGGRLFDYRYYDMDQTVGSSLAKARKELGTAS